MCSSDLSPIIKSSILKAEPSNKNHITVYLPHFDDSFLESHFSLLNDVEFHVFSKKTIASYRKGNIVYQPIRKDLFDDSFIHCTGIITGAGFETPAEALYMNKKILCIPIRGQYEQLCNAEALKKFRVPIIERPGSLFARDVQRWMNAPNPNKLILESQTADIIEAVVQKGLSIKEDPELFFCQFNLDPSTIITNIQASINPITCP